MKRLIVFFTIVFLVFFICGCSIAAGRSSENEESSAVGNNEGQETEADLPNTVPIHDQAKIMESTRNITEGLETYFINMEFKGQIKQLSEWYKKELEEGWQIDSISEGDFEDWTEFYIDAQDSEYYISVYLFQDAGSDTVSIDINIEGKGEAGQAEEESEEVVVEAQDEETTTEPAVAYSGELENASIVFVCASVGSAWNINEHFPDLSINVYDEYQFDKGHVIRNILENDEPDIMIIKECAAYFPPEEMGTSMEAYRDLVRDWVNLCRGSSVIPILTTVVPIDQDNPSNWEGQLVSILEYNDWVKDYCRNEDISVLDLEAALRVSEGNRALDPKYDSGDGLHPNDLAYTEELDHILIPALERALEIGY
jgi:hypothetical protein